MIITVDLIIKVFFTAILAYFTLNTFFKFQFALEKNILILTISGLIILYLNRNSIKLNDILLPLTVSLIIVILLYLIDIYKKQHYYILLNFYQIEFEHIKKMIVEFSNEFEINTKNISYNKKSSFILKFRNINHNKQTKIIQKLEKTIFKEPKKFTYANYWFIIAFLIIIAAVWRF